MRVPSFAIICCCCCTHAFLTAKDLTERALLSDATMSVGDLKELLAHEHTSNLETAIDEQDEKWTTAQTWGYATLGQLCLGKHCLYFNKESYQNNSVSVALSGILLLQCRNQHRKQLVSDFFVALGISTMLGDAFFHIIPHMLGLHDHHEHHDADQDFDKSDTTFDEHDDEADELIMIGKIGTLVGSMYAMWFIGALLKMTGKSTGHSHNAAIADDCCGPIPLDDVNELTEKNDQISWSTVGGILISDCMCNFSDGIAMGVSWTSGASAGLGTMLAIMIHEIPHVTGNFVLYRKQGLSSRAAFGLNVISAGCSFVGLYIGLALGSDPDVIDWLLAMVAGLFIHVSLVNIVSCFLVLTFFQQLFLQMPNMKLEAEDKKKTARFAMQNLGLLLGFTIMVLIAVFEDDIEQIF